MFVSRRASKVGRFGVTHVHLLQRRRSLACSPVFSRVEPCRGFTYCSMHAIYIYLVCDRSIDYDTNKSTYFCLLRLFA